MEAWDHKVDAEGYNLLLFPPLPQQTRYSGHYFPLVISPYRQSPRSYRFLPSWSIIELTLYSIGSPITMDPEERKRMNDALSAKKTIAQLSSSGRQA